jgi:hypothetical protein
MPGLFFEGTEMIVANNSDQNGGEKFLVNAERGRESIWKAQSMPIYAHGLQLNKAAFGRNRKYVSDSRSLVKE